jgi:uracil DNA glycosylase
LTVWAEGGVLMLNTCLTVRAHKAGSHQGKGWEQFTDRVIEVVDRYGGANLGAKSGLGRGVVFLAWGSWAAKRVAKLSKVSVQRLSKEREAVSSPLDPSTTHHTTPLFLLRFHPPFFFTC